jgi:phosphotransferase system HPr-like phosphotransfer protein
MQENAINIKSAIELLVLAIKEGSEKPSSDWRLATTASLAEIKSDFYSESKNFNDYANNIQSWSLLTTEKKLGSLVRLRAELMNVTSDLNELTDLIEEIVCQCFD